MRTLEILMASLMLHGCVIAGSDSALVAGLSGPMTDHAAALAVDGGPLSQRTGRVLIAKFDAGGPRAGVYDRANGWTACGTDFGGV